MLAPFLLLDEAGAETDEEEGEDPPTVTMTVPEGGDEVGTETVTIPDGAEAVTLGSTAGAGAELTAGEEVLELETRAPGPQGTDVPSGWTASGAGTVAPVAEAIVKRVVHVRFAWPYCWNW